MGGHNNNTAECGGESDFCAVTECGLRPVQRRGRSAVAYRCDLVARVHVRCLCTRGAIAGSKEAYGGAGGGGGGCDSYSTCDLASWRWMIGGAGLYAALTLVSSGGFRDCRGEGSGCSSKLQIELAGLPSRRVPMQV